MTTQANFHVKRVFILLTSVALLIGLGRSVLAFAQSSNLPVENDIIVPIRQSDAYGFFAQITSPDEGADFVTRITAYGETDNANEQVGDPRVGGVWASAEFSLQGNTFELTADFSPLKSKEVMVVILNDKNVVNYSVGLAPDTTMIASPSGASTAPPNVAMASIDNDHCAQFKWVCPTGMPTSGYVNGFSLNFEEIRFFQASGRSGQMVAGNRIAFLALDGGITTEDLTAFKLSSSTPIKLADYNVNFSDLSNDISTSLRYSFKNRPQTVGFAADVGLTEPLTATVSGGSFNLHSVGTVNGISNQQLSGIEATFNDNFDRLAVVPDIGDRLKPVTDLGIIILDDGVPVGGEPHRITSVSDNLRSHGYSGWLTCIYFMEPLGPDDILTVPRFATFSDASSLGAGFSYDAASFGLSGLHNLDPISLKFDKNVSFELTNPDAPSDIAVGDQIIFLPFSPEAPDHDQITGVALDADGLEMELRNPSFVESEPTSFNELAVTKFNANLGRVNGLLTAVPTIPSAPAGLDIDTGNAEFAMASLRLPPNAPNGAQISVEARASGQMLGALEFIKLGDIKRVRPALPASNGRSAEAVFIKFDGILDGSVVHNVSAADVSQLPSIEVPSIDDALINPYQRSGNSLVQLVRLTEPITATIGGVDYLLDTLRWTSDATDAASPVSNLRLVISNGGGLGLADVVLGSADFKTVSVKSGENTRLIPDKALSFAPLKPAEFFNAVGDVDNQYDAVAVQIFVQKSEVKVTVPVTQAFDAGTFSLATRNANGDSLNQMNFEPSEDGLWIMLRNQANSRGWNMLKRIQLRKADGSSLTVPLTATVAIEATALESLYLSPYRYQASTNEVNVAVTVPVTQAFKVMIETPGARSTSESTQVVEANDLRFFMDNANRTDTRVATFEVSGEGVAEISILDIVEDTSVPTAVQTSSSGVERHGYFALILIVLAFLAISSSRLRFNR